MDSNKEDIIEVLRQQLAEKDAEIERLNHDFRIEFGDLYDSYSYQKELLADSQAREHQLREALRYGKIYTPKGSLASGVVAAALAQPQDTSALEALITKAGEVMRERCTVRAGLFGSVPYDVIHTLPGVTLEDLK